MAFPRARASDRACQVKMLTCGREVQQVKLTLPALERNV